MNNCEVTIRGGKVRGKQEDGVYKWLGIPYAKKPLGELRFRHAEPAEPWSGVLNTSEYPKRPIQGEFFIQNPNVQESEDCLYLNVISDSTKKKKPVLVWIFGGAFIVGETTLNMYDGTEFAKNDIVFVSINYRVGIQGGFDLSNLRGGNEEFDDNIFISDQILALKWIKENIQFFGGDPEDVTIMGVSAGGTSVVNLMAAPEAEGLFHKVICESAVIGGTVTPEVGNYNMRLLLEHLNISENEIEKVKDLSVEELREAPVWLINNYSRYAPGSYLAGSMTGSLLPELPLEAIKKGSAKGVKLLLGTNVDESSIFISKKDGKLCSNREEVERFLNNIHTSPELKKRLHTFYSDYGTLKGINKFMSDLDFRYHSALLADYQSSFGDTYMYHFSYATLMAKLLKYGTFHASELPFVFNTVNKYEMKIVHLLTSKNTLNYFTTLFHSKWINFVKFGNPNGSGDSPWPKYDVNTRKVYQIDKKCRVLENPYREMVEIIGQLNINL